MKYYAVKKGLSPGIYLTWEECQANVINYSEAVYKSFNNLEDAKKFLNDEIEKTSSLIFEAYVDGSFNPATNEYSMGGVLISPDGKILKFKKKFNDDLSSHRNVSGEVKGAAYIINYCINNNIKELRLYYDYVGIEKWFNNSWQANTILTNNYKSFANTTRDKIKVEFVKVKSHSNDKYNDMADMLAKEALGLN